MALILLLFWITVIHVLCATHLTLVVISGTHTIEKHVKEASPDCIHSWRSQCEGEICWLEHAEEVVEVVVVQDKSNLFLAGLVNHEGNRHLIMTF